ncbi:MAG: NnrS family protein [Rhodospirillaceae bacterium]
MTESPSAPSALFSLGLRPFFLASALWAVVAMFLWLPAWMGVMEIPTAFDPVAWHTHEMLFGYAGAAAAGFLLTAVPSWTGSAAVKGAPLIGLLALWIVARAAVFASGLNGPLMAALADVAFYGALALWTARAVLASGNKRNFVVVVLIALLGIAALLHHLEPLGVAETAETAVTLGLAVFALLVGVIGGRVVPNFTRNALSKLGKTALPAPFGGVDKAALGLLVAAMLAWVLLPDGPILAVLAGLAGLANLARLARWQPLTCLGDPLLWVLHAGYLWLGLGLLLLAAGAAELLPMAAAVHALGVGAFGTMIIGIMTRATRGHTGRDLSVGWGTALIYGLVIAAAALRVVAAIWPETGIAGLHGAAGLWMLGHLGFLLLYGPMLLKPRMGGA